jgi:hypothetical protein
MIPKKCSCCGGENLREGRFQHGGHCAGVKFQQEPRSFFSFGGGLRPKGFACKDCGHVSLFLTDEDREKLDDR